ncbi:Bak protein [Grouper iridovirus]|uniref:Bak protein n=1 Tax=Grouper iridovirus TaxID=127569 RepID=Q5GAF0_9VIRU|nr:Bak protein [Grouper iridovirus]
MTNINFSALLRGERMCPLTREIHSQMLIVTKSYSLVETFRAFPRLPNILEIGNNIVSDGNLNWGRILILLGISQLYFTKSESESERTQITEQLERFFRQDAISNWIASNGGWVTCASLDLRNYSSVTNALQAMCFFGALFGTIAVIAYYLLP